MVDLNLIFIGFVILVALVFDFTNGMHDAANSIATVVSTRVLSPRLAVIWAAFFNFVAFFIFGTAVAVTIGKGMIDVQSINETGFWAGIRARRNAAGVLEIAFGHHRMAAAKHALGENHVGTFEIGDFSDLEMLRMMAHENSDAYAEDVGGAMLCVYEARRALTALMARVPTLALPSRDTNKSRKAAKYPGCPPNDSRGMPHPGDLKILWDIFGNEGAYQNSHGKPGRSALVKFLSGAIGKSGVVSCLVVLDAQEKLGADGAHAIAQHALNATAMQHQTQAIVSALDRGDIEMDDVEAITADVRALMERAQESGDRNSKNSRAVSTATNKIIKDRAVKRGDKKSALNAARAELVSSMERLPADIRASSNALGRFVKQCRDAEVTILTDVRGQFGGLYSAVAITLSNIAALLETVSIEADSESYGKMLRAATKIVAALEPQDRPRLRAIAGGKQ